MFIFFRAAIYSALFIGFVLIFLPARVLSSAGIVRPAAIGTWQVAGTLTVVSGAILVLSCILTFVFVGRGTPAPFDPPRRLVMRGPYRLVRNPMYIGAGLALTGATFFYQSFELLWYIGACFLVIHLFVVAYEEPTLRRTFGTEYDAYAEHTGRWWPRRRSGEATVARNIRPGR
jgi:protein-S-isoprenylcysteine O-methyltransferase Ste14